MVAGDIRGRGTSSPPEPTVLPPAGPGSVSRRSSTRSFLRCRVVAEGCSWGPALVQSCKVWQASQKDPWPYCPSPKRPFFVVEAQGVLICEGSLVYNQGSSPNLVGSSDCFVPPAQGRAGCSKTERYGHSKCLGGCITKTVPGHTASLLNLAAPAVETAPGQEGMGWAASDGNGTGAKGTDRGGGAALANRLAGF